MLTHWGPQTPLPWGSLCFVIRDGTVAMQLLLGKLRREEDEGFLGHAAPGALGCSHCFSLKRSTLESGLLLQGAQGSTEPWGALKAGLAQQGKKGQQLNAVLVQSLGAMGGKYANGRGERNNHSPCKSADLFMTLFALKDSCWFVPA